MPVVAFPKSVVGILGNNNWPTVYFDSVERLNTIGLPKELEGVHACHCCFGIPLVTGTVALLGYGMYEAYKRMTSRS